MEGCIKYCMALGDLQALSVNYPAMPIKIGPLTISHTWYVVDSNTGQFLLIRSKCWISYSLPTMVPNLCFNYITFGTCMRLFCLKLCFCLREEGGREDSKEEERNWDFLEHLLFSTLGLLLCQNYKIAKEFIWELKWWSISQERHT